MDYIVKNDYEAIMYDPLHENGRILKGIKLILSFLGVPVSFIEMIIRFTLRIKIFLLIIVGLCVLALTVYLLVFKMSHLVLIVSILLIDYYFRINSIIKPF